MSNNTGKNANFSNSNSGKGRGSRKITKSILNNSTPRTNGINPNTNRSNGNNKQGR